MRKFWERKRPEKSREIPVYPPGYAGETVAVQLRILRAHVAAQAGEISNLKTAMDVKFSQHRSDLEHISQQIDDVNRAVAVGIDKLRHPSSGRFLG